MFISDTILLPYVCFFFFFFETREVLLQVKFHEGTMELFQCTILQNKSYYSEIY